MGIIIEDFQDKGIIDKECIVLRITDSDDIGLYIIIATSIKEKESVSSRIKQTYWFPQRIVSPGDIVVLYTKSGIDRFFQNANGSYSYLFHWGIQDAMWTEENDCAVLFSVRAWYTKEAFPKS